MQRKRPHYALKANIQSRRSLKHLERCNRNKRRPLQITRVPATSPPNRVLRLRLAHWELHRPRRNPDISQRCNGIHIRVHQGQQRCYWRHWHHTGRWHQKVNRRTDDHECAVPATLGNIHETPRNRVQIERYQNQWINRGYQDIQWVICQINCQLRRRKYLHWIKQNNSWINRCKRVIQQIRV